MNFPTITFIGGGNMARGILGGLLKQGFSADRFGVIEPHENTARALRQDFSVTTHAQVDRDVLNSDYVILAVKPQSIKSVCLDLAKQWADSNARLISIAAGVRTHSIATWLGHHSQDTLTVIRAMPNTPALIGLGATGLFSEQTLDEDTRQGVETIFSAVGMSVWLETEAQLDSVTALSGSGPAYFFYMLESLISAGIAQGLSPSQSEKLLLQTALGAAHMAANTLLEKGDNKLARLREQVTSKGGTTAAGLKSLQHNNFAHILEQAVNAARQRSQELSDEYAP